MEWQQHSTGLASRQGGLRFTCLHGDSPAQPAQIFCLRLNRPHYNHALSNRTINHATQPNQRSREWHRPVFELSSTYCWMIEQLLSGEWRWQVLLSEAKRLP